jgi:ABC-type sugar transport system ATPase subunit
MILHNYVHVLAACDRVNLIQDGVISFDKLTSETSVEELTDIVVEEYRRARMASNIGAGGNGAGRKSASVAGDPLGGPGSVAGAPGAQPAGGSGDNPGSPTA